MSAASAGAIAAVTAAPARIVQNSSTPSPAGNAYSHPSSRRGVGHGQMRGKCRPLPRHALDGQPSAVAVENVLDQRQAEAGAALRAALGHVDPVETLSQ